MRGEARLREAMLGEAMCEVKPVFRYTSSTSISFNKLF